MERAADIVLVVSNSWAFLFLFVHKVMKYLIQVVTMFLTQVMVN